MYLLFYQFVLQSEDPIIPVIWDQASSFLKKLLGKFITASIKRATLTLLQWTIALRTSCKVRIKHSVIYIYTYYIILDNELHIGLLTRQYLRRLQNEVDITAAEVKKFYQAVRSFYTQATDYAFKNLPMNDDIINREQAYFMQVEFFVQRYPNLLPFVSPSTLNELEEEFLDYQLMLSAEIPDDVWKSAIKIDEDEKDIQNGCNFGVTT